MNGGAEAPPTRPVNLALFLDFMYLVNQFV